MTPAGGRFHARRVGEQLQLLGMLLTVAKSGFYPLSKRLRAPKTCMLCSKLHICLEENWRSVDALKAFISIVVLCFQPLLVLFRHANTGNTSAHTLLESCHFLRTPTSPAKRPPFSATGWVPAGFCSYLPQGCALRKDTAVPFSPETAGSPKRPRRSHR